MSIGQTVSRLFRRNSRNHNRIRPLSRWGRTRLNLDYLEDRRVPATITVTNSLDDTTGGNGVSLREAVNAIIAGGNSGDVVAVGAYGTNDSIVFNGALANSTININPQFAITKSMAITGLGMASITINNVQAAGINSRIFDVSGTGTVFKVSDLKVSGGNLTSTNVGAAIRINGSDVQLTSVHLDNNIGATGAGGAIAMLTTAGKLTMSSSSVTNNSTNAVGGAINNAIANSTITISSTTFNNNSGTNGGAISLAALTNLTLTGNTFSANVATSTGGGGALVASTGASTITSKNNLFSNNVQSNSTTTIAGGGAIRLGVTSITFSSDSDTFSGNSAFSSGGGAIFANNAATITINDGTFTGNQALGSASTQGGGAIFVSSATTTLTINRSTFSSNSANVSGGAIFSDDVAILTINNSTLSNNTAGGNAASGTQGGGAIFLNDSGIQLAINNSTIVNNTASGLGQGGGILKGQTTSSKGFNAITSSIIAGNTAAGFGQDMRFTFGHLKISGGGANLVGVADDGNFSFGVTGAANKTGTLASPLNPLVGPLANNGGQTQTHGLLLGSPAIGAGAQNGLTTDQIGNARPSLSPSIGSVETVLTAPSVRSTLAGVTTAGGTTYAATVIYQSGSAIATTTIDTNDVTISGLGSPSSKTINSISGDGKSVTVTYTFAAPGGAWDAADNGTYTLTMVGSEVFDSGANSVAAGKIGSFLTSISNTYIVDNNATDTDDANYGVGQLTLREAIMLSNTNNVGFPDLITFDTVTLGASPTITLTSQIDITDPVNIQGPGKNLLVSGGGATRIFNFNITGTAINTASSISSLTLTNGKAAAGSGGAILLTAANTVNINNAAITNSTASSGSGGAISMTGGWISLVNSTISGGSVSGSGGGINASTGRIDLTNSMISGNVAAGSGGAINTSSGVIYMVNSTLGENVANGAATASGGGGIMSTSGSNITIVNSTLGRNTATSGRGGAILSVTSGANLTIYNSTIAQNTAGDLGGGVAGNVTSTGVTPFVMDLRSTIVSNNAATNGDADLHQQVFTAGVYNNTINDSIVGVGSNMVFSGSNNQTGVVDAMLTPLSFYGGLTKTIGLLNGSPAFDKGSNVLGLTTDQRGATFPRVVDGTPYGGTGLFPDVGAFEGLSPLPPFGSATLNPPTNGASTYVATVVYSSANANIDTTTIDANDVTLSGGAFVGNQTPTIAPGITGSGSSVTVTYTFNAPGGTWGFEDNGTYTLTLQNNQIFDSNSLAAAGGSLGSFAVNITTTWLVDEPGDLDDANYAVGELTLREAVKLANQFSSIDTIAFDTTSVGLGANPTITLTGELSVTQSVVITGQPGIVIQGGGTRLFNVAISGIKGAVSMSDLTLTGGSATTTTAGGAILNADEALTLTNMTFNSNVASGSFSQGGAIASSGSGAVVNISKSFFTGNNATGGGGAIYFSSAGSITIDSTTFNSNSAGSGGSNGGGAIYSQGALSVDIGDSTFSNNTTSANWGGAIALASGYTITIDNSKFDTNSSSGSGGGGAIYASTGLSAASVTINNSTFTMNSHSALGGNGGAIYLSSDTTTLTINKSTFSNNTAGTGSGGAVYVTSAADATITNSTFTNNAAKSFGGGIGFLSTSTVQMDGVLISGNIVDGGSAEGGGMYVSGGSLDFKNGAIVNNTAASSSSSGGSGGGISGGGTTMTISNSTLSGNSVFGSDTSNINGGGAIALRFLSGGPLTIYNSTITNNTATFTAGGAKVRGGGILVSRTTPSVFIESSIVAGNINPNNETDIYLVNSGSISGDNNIVGVTDSLTLTGANNKTGTLASPFNPGIFPLGNYGGTTPTHPLWYNSPALNAGLNSQSISFDQRGTGFPRVLAGTPDIGAFEGFVDVSPFVSKISGIVNITAASGSAYEFTVTYDGFKGVDSTTVGTGDVELVLPSGAKVTPTLVSKTLMGNAVEAKYSFTPPVNKLAGWDPTDNGSYQLNLLATEVADLDTIPKTVPAQTLGTFTSKIAGTFVVDKADVDNDDFDYSTGQLTLREAVKLSNFSETDQDVIGFSLPGGTTITLATQLSITDEVNIQGSGASQLTISGGGGTRMFSFEILGAGGDSTISGVTLTSGSAMSGGAINMDNDPLTLNNVTVTNNSATSGTGGAIALTAANLTITNAVFSGNSASGDGGAIKASATSGSFTVSINGSTFLGNQGAAGGAISMPTSNSGGKLEVTDSSFTGNTASGNGGAISLTVSPLTMDRSILRSNVSNSSSSSGGGGALSINTSIVTITNSEISDNQVTGATAGGGAMRVGGSSTNITIQNSTVSGNSAAGNGGAFIFNSSTSPTFNLKNSTVSNNTAGSGKGGAIYTAGTGSSQPTINLISSIVAKNADTVTADIWTALDGSTTSFNLNVAAADSIVSLNTSSRVIINTSGTSSVGTTGSPIDAKLGALANNGGPTLTHALLAGSPAINTGSNPDALTFDQRGTPFQRAVGQTDMGAYEDQTAPAVSVTAVQFGDGTAQRSMVKQVVITFSAPVTFTGAVANAFTLFRHGTGGVTGNVTFAATQSGGNTVVTLDTFTGGLASFGSLIDGYWDITIDASQIVGSGGSLDGVNDEIVGGNYHVTGNSPQTSGTPNNHFRLYGDGDGNGTVNQTDFIAFRNAFNNGPSGTWDYEGDGNVTQSDFTQFRNRFNLVP